MQPDEELEIHGENSTFSFIFVLFIFFHSINYSFFMKNSQSHTILFDFHFVVTRCTGMHVILHFCAWNPQDLALKCSRQLNRRYGIPPFWKWNRGCQVVQEPISVLPIKNILKYKKLNMNINVSYSFVCLVIW